MRLYLLRNAEAIPGKKDARRELSSNGIESLEKLAVFLNENDPLKSPTPRRKQRGIYGLLSHFA